MGYDFTMLKKPPLLPHGYQPYYEESPEEYQLSGAGMSMIYEAMKQVGLLDEVTGPPDFSGVWPPSGIDEDRAEWIAESVFNDKEVDPLPSAAELDLVRQAQIQLEKLLSSESPHTGKVPSFKFGSNDGWIVTARECDIIARKLAPPTNVRIEQMPDRGEMLDVIHEWVDFNNAAALNGGYRVT